MRKLRSRSRANFREEEIFDDSSKTIPPSTTLSPNSQHSDCAKPECPFLQAPLPVSQTLRRETPTPLHIGRHEMCDCLHRTSNLKRFAIVPIFAVIGALTIVVACGGWFRWASVTSDPVPSIMPTTSTSSTPTRGAAHLAPKAHLLPHQIPVVHRSVLEKLEGNSARRRKGVTPSNQWPPSATRIPEATATLPNQLQSHVCDNSNPESCRFLFPFRISDQEYNVRGHIEQLAKLALELNRTLVLPNVAKSRAGACYKYDFEVYYDVQSLQESLGVSVITMDAFKSWAGSRVSTTAQIVTLSTQPWRNVTSPVVTDENAFVQVDHFRDAKDYKFPSCFLKKFPYLVPGHSPHLIISPSSSTNRLIGSSIVNTLSGKTVDLENVVYANNQGLFPYNLELGSQVRPEVLLVNYGLLHPIFQPSLDPALQYSLDLRVLAQQIAPSEPYLAIYWNMKSLSPDLLELCAQALVDTIGSLLLESTLSSAIKNVWFSSDYPYPLSQTAPYSRWAVPNDVQFDPSNDITGRHAEAGTLWKAFENGGELSQWSLTDFVGETSHIGKENKLLQDRGVLGILERTISSRAALFVTASSNTCGGASSTVTRIIDMRRRYQARPRGTMLRNLVDVFG